MSIQFYGPSPKAGGWPAIKSTMQKAYQEVGLWKSIKILSSANQKQGFDCPGCAWPDPDDHRSRAEFCENGAKAIADEATDKKVGPDFFKEHSIDQLKEKSSQWLNSCGRLTHPMHKPVGSSHYQPISWMKAFELVASQIKSSEDPDRNIFYTSGRTSNEAAFLYQLLIRMTGTNNLPDCSNLCHESSGKGLTKAIGIGKGTVTLKDLEETDLIVVVGQNPGSNHPRMLSALQKAKRRGAKIISINPLREPGSERFIHPQEAWNLLGSGTQLSDLHLPVRIGMDVALFQYLSSELIRLHETGEKDAIDVNFIREHTAHFEQYKSALSALDRRALMEVTGLDSTLLDRALNLIRCEKNIIVCWAMGLTQHKNAVDNIREVVNFLLLKGSIGRPKAGVCPVRGHSNVQGDRTMGIWEAPSEAFLHGVETGLDLEPDSLPRKHGVAAVEAVQQIEKGECNLFMSLGGNFVEAMSDTKRLKEVFKQVPLTIQVSTKLNASHLWTGEQALIFPVLGRTEVDSQATREQFVTVENSMGIVHSSTGRLKPASRLLKSEVAVVCEIGKRLFPELNWQMWMNNYDHIRDLIAKSISGFENFNERVRQPGGFYLPNAVRDENKYNTESGKAEFYFSKTPKWQLDTNEFLMMTIRTHDQFNTTVYSSNDRYRGVYAGRKVALMNKNDMDKQDLKQGDLIDITSHYHGRERKVKSFHCIPYEIPEQCMATYFPEANDLVPLEEFADVSKTPVSKSVVVEIQKS